MAADFPPLPTIKFVKTKDNVFTWSFEDGTTTFSATTEVVSTAIGLDKACTLQNSDLEATVTLSDSDLTSGIAVGVYPYILQTASGGLDTPVSWLGKIEIHAAP